MPHASLDDIVARCDAFEESKHPRDQDGKFGSGGNAGGAGRSPAESHSPPFVGALKKEHGSRKAIAKHLESVPKEKLMKALGFLKGHDDPDSATVKKLIESELDDRANRGI